MRSPVMAMTWDFWWRHRLGLAAVWALVLGFCAFSILGLNTTQSARVQSIWLVMGLAYVIGVFAYGFEGRLETAESGFPTRQFILPVRTWLLVASPMLQGIVTAVLLWVLWDRFVLQQNDVKTPLWWTAMLAAVVATSQALVWQPFGLPWVRIVITVPILSALIRAEAIFRLAGFQFEDSNARDLTLSLFALLVTIGAGLVAWFGVSCARHGQTRDWLGFLRTKRLFGGSWQERHLFASPLKAQIWYEWRRRELGYLIAVMSTIAAVMGVSFIFENTAQQMSGYAYIFFFLPIIISGFWGNYMGGGDSVKMMSEMTAFASTRPMSNTAMVVAKIRMAGFTATLTWSIAITLAIVWLVSTGGFNDISRMWRWSVEHLGKVGAVVLFAINIVGPILIIWRLLTVNLWVGLMGRNWLSHALTSLMTLIGSNGLILWLWSRVEPDRFDRLLAALPWVLGLLIVVKLIAAGKILQTLHGRGDVNARTIQRLVGLWFVVAASIFAIAVWLIPEGSIPFYAIPCSVILLVPFTRLAFAPLALAWNRQR